MPPLVHPSQGTMHRPSRGGGHRMLCTPPPRCRALPTRCRASDVVHSPDIGCRALPGPMPGIGCRALSRHRVRWRTSGAVHSRRCRPLPGRWRPSGARGAHRRCGGAHRGAVGARTAGAVVRSVRAPPSGGAHRGAPCARVGALRGARRGLGWGAVPSPGEDGRSRGPLSHTPLTSVPSKSQMRTMEAPLCGRSHQMGSRAGSAGARRTPAGRVVRSVRAPTT